MEAIVTRALIERLKLAAARGVELNKQIGRADNIRFFEGYLKALSDVENLHLASPQQIDGSLETCKLISNPRRTNMWMPVTECLARMSELDDTHELAGRLRDIAELADPGDAYFLREAALNMESMYELTRSMAGRLQHLIETPTSTPPPKQATSNTALYAPTRLPEASSNDKDMLNLPRVLELACVGRTKWLGAVAAGEAPKPVRLGKRTFWLRGEVKGWLDRQIRARDEAKDPAA